MVGLVEPEVSLFTFNSFMSYLPDWPKSETCERTPLVSAGMQPK